MRRVELSATVFVLMLASQANAGVLPCTLVKQGVIKLDGLLGDWRGVRPVVVSGASAITKGARAWDGQHDLSYRVWCNYRPDRLFFAVHVVDDRMIGYAAGQRGDHVVLRIGARYLRVWPSDLKRTRQRLTWGNVGRRGTARRRPRGTVPRGVRAVEALQKDGYSLEIALPMSQIPGYRPGLLGLPFSLSVADTDRSRGRLVTVMDASLRRLSFVQVKSDLEAFLGAINARVSDVRLRRSANVCCDAKLEQVLLVNSMLGVVGKGGGYFFMNLPVRGADDVRWVKLHDLNGDGRSEIMVRFVERAANGSREIVAGFRFDRADQFRWFFAHEVAKRQGSRVLENCVTFRPRRGKRGIDIVFDKPRARGFDAGSYHEDPAEDVFPILLPWKGDQKRSFRFEGEQFHQR